MGGKLPWRIPEDMKSFEYITKFIGRRGQPNGVIMGRRTWESLPTSFKPLPDRSTCIISSNSKLKKQLSNVQVASSLDHAIHMMKKRCDSIYIIGGARVYDEAHKRKLVNRIYWTRVCTGDGTTFDTKIDPTLITNNYEMVALTQTRATGTVTYDFSVLEEKGALQKARAEGRSLLGRRFLTSWIQYHTKNRLSTPDAAGHLVRSLTPTVSDLEMNSARFIKCNPLSSILFNGHQETQYLNIMSDIIDTGLQMRDRTGVGTFAKWGVQMRFDLRQSFPMLTTKRVYWKGVVEELLWFLKGHTDARILAAKDVHIWDANGTKEFLATRGLDHREEGDLGPVYGFQWRHFGADYGTCTDNYEGHGVDQIVSLIEGIKADPYSRRLIVSAWNPAALKHMALPPCHILAQFIVHPELQELSCIMYQRSADWGLGVPFNIASYSLLTLIIAKLTGLKPREFVHMVGNAHVYNDHVEALKTQLKRVPRPFPLVSIRKNADNLDELKGSDFKLIGYEPWPVVKMRMAV